MENLNAEQVKKALECCFVNDWNSTKCNECPFYNGGGGCIDELKEATLALITSQEQRIKELAEENTALFARNLDLAEKGEQVVIAYKKLSEENERLSLAIEMDGFSIRNRLEGIDRYCNEKIKIGKADTVREMRSLIERRSNMCGKMENGLVTNRIYHLTEEDLDQIAKEMLEGDNGIQDK